MLTRDERLLDDWLHHLANMDQDDPEQAALESMGFGLFFRCMVIAALNPSWNFMRVLAEAKRTVQAKIQIPDLMKKRARAN